MVETSLPDEDVRRAITEPCIQVVALEIGEKKLRIHGVNSCVAISYAIMAEEVGFSVTCFG